jgi:hypothetical protein
MSDYYIYIGGSCEKQNIYQHVGRKSMKIYGEEVVTKVVILIGFKVVVE